MIGDPLANKDNKNVMSIVNKGANFLLSKFIGKKTASVDTSIIKMTTTGTSDISGTLSGNSQTNISSLSQLMVPGSKNSSVYVLTPNYNKPLGVFYITKTPTLCLKDKYNKFFPTNSSVPPVHGEGGSSYQRMNIYGYFSIGTKEPIEVVLNPEVASK